MQRPAGYPAFIGKPVFAGQNPRMAPIRPFSAMPHCPLDEALAASLPAKLTPHWGKWIRQPR
jgi:hypothetical protein